MPVYLFTKAVEVEAADREEAWDRLERAVIADESWLDTDWELAASMHEEGQL